MLKKYIFIDRDGTLIDEPEDKQIDSLEKIKLKENVITALLMLKESGYRFVMITNQDGLGTPTFTEESFATSQTFFLNILGSQTIFFEDILICPHFLDDNCQCRKPRLGLTMKYLRDKSIDWNKSYMVGDRQTDMQFAENMGIKGLLFNDNDGWVDITKNILSELRQAKMQRKTTETNVTIEIDLGSSQPLHVDTGLRFFDHMLEQLAKHAGFSLKVKVIGDTDIDEHHTVEDIAIVIAVIREALGDKRNCALWLCLPMDEALANIAIDLSGRNYFSFEGEFTREKVGDLPTELIPHFFRSFTDALGAAMHIKVTGENAHHMIESIFKGVGRTLRQAIHKQGSELASTKGVL